MAGRLLSGGNLHSTSFASLPPRFRKAFTISDTELMRATGVPPLSTVLQAVSAIASRPSTGVEGQLQRIDDKLSTFMSDTLNSIRAIGSRINSPPGQQSNGWSQFSTRNQASIPSNFVMKAVKPMDLWALWYYGDAARNIKPYRLISSDEIEDKNTKTQLTRARKVVQCLEDIAVLKGYISNKQRILSLEYIDSIDIFHKSFEALVRSHPTSGFHHYKEQETIRAIVLFHL